MDRLAMIRPAAGLLAALAAAGCGGGAVKTYPVKAVVRVNGTPAAGANVTLHPTAGEWKDGFRERPFGKVRDDGSVEFSTFAGDGAPAGEYVVTVYWPAPPESGHDGDRLGELHASPERPNAVKVTVNTASTELPPIDLTVAARGR